MQKVYLNIVPGGVVPDINVSQFDSGRTFQLAVMDGGVAADLTGLSVSVSGQKPDSYGFQYTEDDMVGAAHVVAVSGNVVTITTPVQMTAADGRVVCWLSLTDSDDNEISTLYFDMHVQKSPLVGVVISETELPAIIALAQQQEENAEAWAMGTRGGVPVSSDDPAYHNNSKYYMEQAEAAGTAVLEKYPKIVSDYWWIWDIDQDAYVNTGVKALGEDGATGPEGPEGPEGPTGATPNITMSATVDANTGTPSVNVSESGTAENPTFTLEFHNLKGEPGGGGGGGHTIYNGSGTAMADEDGLQFEGGLDVTDDSVGQKTVVSAGKKIAWADASGYVGKNLMQNTAVNDTVNTVAFTVNADKSVTANGTASAATSFTLFDGRGKGEILKNTPLIVSKGNLEASTSVAVNAYNNGAYVRTIAASQGDNYDSSPAFTLDYSDYDSIVIVLWLAASKSLSSVTFYPMLRYADITDDTYEPWIPKNTELVRWTEQNVYGAKNLLPNTAESDTVANVAFTVNADGSVKANGTANAGGNFWIYHPNVLVENAEIPLKGVKLSGCTGGSGSTYRMILQTTKGGTPTTYDLTDGDLPIDITGDGSTTFNGIYIRVSSGAALSNVMFYPMIRLATVEDDTYEPYAMTNQQLTDDLASVNTQLSGLGTASTLAYSTNVDNNDTSLPTGKAVGTRIRQEIASARVINGPVTGYVGDTTLTFSNVYYYKTGGPLMSFFCENTSGKPVTIKTAAWDSVQETITITFDALTEQTDFIVKVDNTY